MADDDDNVHELHTTPLDHSSEQVAEFITTRQEVAANGFAVDYVGRGTWIITGIDRNGMLACHAVPGDMTLEQALDVCRVNRGGLGTTDGR